MKLDIVTEALKIRAGFLGRLAADDGVQKSMKNRAFRNSLDARIGKLKFGGV